MTNIAIFASGSGSNAEQIIKYFKAFDGISVSLIVCNKENAGVLDRAKKLSVRSEVISRNKFYKTDEIVEFLKSSNIDFIVLAGFLWLVPFNLIQAFPNRIINIHPALLPKYGGKGMYGNHVHQAVYEANEKESGITIHYVNEKYDEGHIIFQAKIALEAEDDPAEIAKKIQRLEHQYYPQVIHQLIDTNP